MHSSCLTHVAMVERETAKSFLTNVKPMKAMAQRCPGGHQHLLFGRVKLGPGRYAFATAEEAAYPRILLTDRSTGVSSAEVTNNCHSGYSSSSKTATCA